MPESLSTHDHHNDTHDYRNPLHRGNEIPLQTEEMQLKH
jgi:hypothetical protein